MAVVLLFSSHPQAWERLTEFAAQWEDRYPAIKRESTRSEFIPFFGFPVEIRTILYSMRSSPSTRGSGGR